MPLHDWKDRRGWSGFHTFWMTELAAWVQDRLPTGYRAFLGHAPLVAVELDPGGQPDVSIRSWPDDHPAEAGPPPDGEADEPDVEVATLKIDPDISLFVEYEGRLVAAVEVVSPRNKDRPASRSYYAARYTGYLVGGAHLMLVDVHPQPAKFSFAEAIDTDLSIPNTTPLRPPCAAAYRVGEPAATGGRYVAVWRRPLLVGQPLPTLKLPLAVGVGIPVDLDATYTRAAKRTYLA
ncbi:MAG: DUF4058 family protein [Gemmataceae bacterium]